MSRTLGVDVAVTDLIKDSPAKISIVEVKPHCTCYYEKD